MIPIDLYRSISRATGDSVGDGFADHIELADNTTIQLRFRNLLSLWGSFLHGLFIVLRLMQRTIL